MHVYIVVYESLLSELLTNQNNLVTYESLDFDYLTSDKHRGTGDHAEHSFRSYRSPKYFRLARREHLPGGRE